MSILLDTNVLSEGLRSVPAPSVMEWLGAQASRALFVSSVTQAEMLSGVHLMPSGKRRQLLEQKLALLFGQRFANRLLAFDGRAAERYAEVIAVRQHAGRPIAQFDAQIAAIALAHDMQVATRNVSDFTGCGLDVVNPWD